MSSIQKMIASGGELPPRETTNPRWRKAKAKPRWLRDQEARRPAPPTPVPDIAKIRAAVAKFSHQ